MVTEQEILKLIKETVPNSKQYLNDDAAILKIGNEKIVLTTDTFVEGTHFNYKNQKLNLKTNSTSLHDVGWKAMATNLSDIAAMGAIPQYALVSLSLPNKLSKKNIAELYQGIQSCAKKHKTQIVGGNITRSNLISISITITGKITLKTIGLRSNAKPGDIVFTTGNLGDSAAGFLLLNQKLKRKKQNASLIKKHKLPLPQIELGRKICKYCTRVSLIDSSDGLADCAIQISKASKIKITVYEKLIPVSKDLLKISKEFKIKPLDLALYGGEDYELIGTASKENWKKLNRLKTLKKIGIVSSGSGAYLMSLNNKKSKLNLKDTFQHFK